MPREGYKCITVAEKPHEKIKKRTKKAKLTMKSEYLMAKESVAKEGK